NVGARLVPTGRPADLGEVRIYNSANGPPASIPVGHDPVAPTAYLTIERTQTVRSNTQVWDLTWQSRKPWPIIVLTTLTVASSPISGVCNSTMISRKSSGSFSGNSPTSAPSISNTRTLRRMLSNRSEILATSVSTGSPEP